MQDGANSCSGKAVDSKQSKQPFHPVKSDLHCYSAEEGIHELKSRCYSFNMQALYVTIGKAKPSIYFFPYQQLIKLIGCHNIDTLDK